MIEEEKQRLLKIALKMDVFRKKVSIIQKSFLCSHKITIKKLRSAVDSAAFDSASVSVYHDSVVVYAHDKDCPAEAFLNLSFVICKENGFSYIRKDYFMDELSLTETFCNEMVKRLKYTYRNYYAIIYHCSSLQQIARNGYFHYLSLKEYFTEVPLL